MQQRLFWKHIVSINLIKIIGDKKRRGVVISKSAPKYNTGFVNAKKHKLYMQFINKINKKKTKILFSWMEANAYQC